MSAKPGEHEHARRLLAMSTAGRVCGITAAVLAAALVTGSAIAMTDEWSWPPYLFGLLSSAAVVLMIVAAVFAAAGRLATALVAARPAAPVQDAPAGGQSDAELRGYFLGLSDREPPS